MQRISVPPARPRLLEIDGLRGFAALWVVLFHYLTRYSELYGADLPLGFAFPSGTFGVYLFFMISGFVIVMTLRQCAKPLDFIVSRFARLYPAYWAAVAVTGLIGVLAPLPLEHITVGQILVNLTMLQDFVLVPPIDGVYWTLAVELCFYFAVFLIYLVGALPHIERIAWAWLAVAAAAQIVDLRYAVSLMLVLPYAPLFIIGIVFYLVMVDGYTPNRLALLAVSLVSVAGVPEGWTAFLYAVPCLLGFHLCIGGAIKASLVRPMAWLGGISYPLYLTHQTIGYRVIAEMTRHGIAAPLAVAAAVVLAVLLAWTLSVAVERPAQARIRQAYKARGIPLTTVGHKAV